MQVLILDSEFTVYFYEPRRHLQCGKKAKKREEEEKKSRSKSYLPTSYFLLELYQVLGRL